MSRDRITILHTELLRENMLKQPMSFDQMAELAGLSKQSVQRWVRAIRAAKLMYIAAYGPDVNGRLFVPLFAWGKGDDVERPGQVRTAAERMRAKRSADAELLRKSLIGKLST